MLGGKGASALLWDINSEDKLKVFRARPQTESKVSRALKEAMFSLVS